MLIKTYTSNWIKDFNDIKREIQSGLSGLHYTIEHIGSTSVQDLDAKPIIDIDLIYSEETDFEKVSLGLQEMGYYHNGNQGIEDRDVFKRIGKATNKILDTVKHHLYVCPTHSKALERHLLSRNFLRENQWARRKYQQMKYALAEEARQDSKVYAVLKEHNVNDFIDAIVEEQKRK